MKKEEVFRGGLPPETTVDRGPSQMCSGYRLLRLRDPRRDGGARGREAAQCPTAKQRMGGPVVANHVSFQFSAHEAQKTPNIEKTFTVIK